MDVWFNIHSYDTYGGHRTISLVGNWLQEHRAAAGVDLAELDLEANLRHAGPPRKTLEGIFEQFHRNLGHLPLVVFSPKKKRLKISFRSELGEARAITKDRELSSDLFIRAFDELISTVRTIPLEKKKGLDARALREWMLQARDVAPRGIDDLRAFEEWYRAEAKRRIDAMSPWERLAIDWDEFHPAARTILDDPFFWSEIDDYAPHGNDTGADLLHMLRGSRVAEQRPKEFLRQTFRTWGMAETVDGALGKAPGNVLEAEETALFAWDEAAIALAFGFAKLHGHVPTEARDLAIQAIARERLMADARGAPTDEERLRALTKLEKKLVEISG